MSGPLISVIIPTFRRPDMLKRAIRSAQAQIFKDLAIHIFDNASGDQTREIVEQIMSHDPRITYHCNDVNVGAAGNFRLAISSVTTPFFCLLSDDDILLPKCLQSAMAGMTLYPQAMAWSGIVISANTKQATSLKPWPAWPRGFASPALSCLLVSRDCRPETTGMVFRSSIISERFLGSRPHFIASDVGWVLEAAKLGGIGHTPEPSAVFFQHAGSLSTEAGTSYKQAAAIYWPSVRYLSEHFIAENTLPNPIKKECNRAIKYNYGVRNFRRFAAEALLRRDNTSLCSFQDILAELDDVTGLQKLQALRCRPLSFVRYELRTLKWISRMRKVIRFIKRKIRMIHLTKTARHYLQAYQY